MMKIHSYSLTSALRTLFIGSALVFMSSAPVLAAPDIHGVRVDDTVQVSGTPLNLNGAGTRYKGPFKVYVATLHTPKRVSSLDELVNTPGPKRLQLTMLREVEAESFGKLLTQGVEDNVPRNELSKLVPGLLRMGELFAAHKTLMPGESIVVDWVPGTGMVVTVKGRVQGAPFKEPEFYKAIMSIWFGPVPADFKLKDALLGLK